MLLTTNETRTSDFIGREQELAQLKTVLDDALSGRGRVVMLAGEPGIGKTRLAHELVALAEQRGARVLWGWCYEHRGALFSQATILMLLFSRFIVPSSLVLLVLWIAVVPLVFMFVVAFMISSGHFLLATS